MWRHGTTDTGKVRWYCQRCKKSGIKKRPDVASRQWVNIMRRWLIEGVKLKTIAKERKLHLHYVQTKCAETLRGMSNNNHSAILDSTKPLLLDGTWIVPKKLAVLIASDADKIIHWRFILTENIEAWQSFLSELSGQPKAIVSDAQKGLLLAVNLRFGNIHQQRCLAHIVRQARLWLTQNPKTEAGLQLLELVDALAAARTLDSADNWSHSYQTWLIQWQDFLKERSYFEQSTRWWYTHRKLRATRSLLTNAWPHLFIHISHDIPNTTNALEGGINGPLKFVFKEHRGLSLEHKKALVNIFLNERLREKNQH